jgi:hypothetical protein
MIRDGQPLPRLAEAEQRLTAALSLLAGESVAAEPLDTTATVFRVNVAKHGWTTRELFDRREGRKSAGALGLQPFDLLALEYPHASELPASDPLTHRLEKFLAVKNNARPVAYFRGDWLASALAANGKLTPLGEDIRSLAALEKASAAGMPAPPGPGFPRAVGTAPPFVAEKFADDRVAVPPLFGWYAGDVAPNPTAFTLTAELVAGGQPVKSVKCDQKFKLRVQCDRTVSLALFHIHADGEVVIPDIGDDTRPRANAVRELATDGRDFNIASNTTGGDLPKEFFLLFASEAELPRFTVACSRHDDRPPWRILLPKDAKRFDPNKVVRKVIPIPLTK